MMALFVVVTAFERLAVEADALIANNIRDAATLATLRDTLLPKFISGDIRVKHAEKLVEAST